MWHDNAAKEWVALGAWDLVPSDITYKLKINSRTVQRERTGAGVGQEGVTDDCGTDTLGAAQGGRARTLNGVARLVGQPGKVQVPAESRVDISVHSF